MNGEDEPSNEDTRPPRVTIWIRVRETLSVVLKKPEKPRAGWRGKLTRFLSEEKRGLGLVVFLVLFIQLLEFHGLLAGIEGLMLDKLLGNPSRDQAAASGSPIVTVEIDDDGYRDCFGGSSPLNPTTVADMVTKLASVQPKILGIDILTDSKKPENQDGYRTLSAKWSRKVAGDAGQTVIWAAAGEEARVEAVGFGWWILGYPDKLVVRPSSVLGRADENLETAPFEWALPIFPRDEDLRLRRFPREVEIVFSNEQLPERRPTWARMIAQRYCDAARCEIETGDGDVFVSSKVRIGQHFTVKEVFGCAGNEAGPLEPSVAGNLNGRIVLLGGTFGNARDTYETADGPVPGLLINAYAIQAEIDHATISEAWHWATVLGDLFLGCWVVYIFWTYVKVKRMMELCVLLIVGAVLLSVLALSAGIVWVSCIGVAAGVVLHMLVEIYKMDLKKPEHHAH